MKTLLTYFYATLLSLPIVGQSLYFPPLFSNEWDTVEADDLGWCDDRVDELVTFLDGTNTKGFIILRDGKMAMEEYFDDHTQITPWYWASAGKSLTAFMIGIAQQDGLLDITDPTSTYLGNEWTTCSPDQESNITLVNQLSMTTGLDYTVADPDCISPECLHYLNDAGTEWYYHNAPYSLLADVIESASGETYTSYTNTNLAVKIGFLGQWTSNGQNRLFFSSTRGMARFGLLSLAEGHWDGEAILDDAAYFNGMVSKSQDINESYGYLWWLNAADSYMLPGSTLVFNGHLIPDAPEDLYAAIGKNGQVCIVVPSENLVMVRMGDNPDLSLVPLVFVREMWSYYQRLECNTSTMHHTATDIKVWPRLTSDYINIECNGAVQSIDVLDRQGRIVLSVGSADVLDVGRLNTGLYFVRVSSGHAIYTERIMKID